MEANWKPLEIQVGRAAREDMRHPRPVAQDFDAERGARVVSFTRSLQPDILVNNRCANPGDFDTPEQTVGRFQNKRPWESCITICNQWAYKPDDAMKPLKQCIQTLVRCAGGDGNLLFNVGPMPTGEIEPRQVKRLAEMGQWLRNYGRSIYSTRGGPYRPGGWGCSTFRGKTVYLHLMDWTGGPVTLPGLPLKVVAARALTGGKATVTQTADALLVAVPEVNRDAVDTLVELTLDRSADGIRPIAAAGSLTAGKAARASNVYGGSEAYAANKALDDDESTRWATDGGTHSVWLDVDLGRPTTFNRVRILQEPEYAARIRSFELEVREGDGWTTILTGTTMPAEYLEDFPPVTAQVVRLNILNATDGATINDVAGLHGGYRRVCLMTPADWWRGRKFSEWSSPACLSNGRTCLPRP